MTQIEQDLQMASLLIEGKELPDHLKAQYQKVYSCQTENSRKLFSQLSRSWDHSLWIGGSGDQPINGILYGSRNLIIVDKNPLAPYYILFKIAALQALSRDEFLRLFAWNMKQDVDLKTLYQQIAPFLQSDSIYFDSDSDYFWKNIISNYSKEEISENFFYHEIVELDRYMPELMLSKNPYLEKKFYSYLKKVIPRTKIRLYRQDIQNIQVLPISEPLDKIYLSNVFLEMGLSLNEYQNFLQNNIYPLLSKKGDAMIGYLNLSYFSDAILGTLGTTDEIVSFFKEQGCRLELLFEDQFYKQLSSAFVYQKKR